MDVTEIYDPRSNEMPDEALVNMDIKDTRPVSVVEDEGLREVIYSTYVLPTRKVCMCTAVHLNLPDKNKYYTIDFLSSGIG